MAEAALFMTLLFNVLDKATFHFYAPISFSPGRSGTGSCEERRGHLPDRLRDPAPGAAGGLPLRLLVLGGTGFAPPSTQMILPL
jgi:hypothetical protein